MENEFEKTFPLGYNNSICKKPNWKSAGFFYKEGRVRMKKGKICMAAVLALVLCGCGAKEEAALALTAEQQEKYTQMIDDVTEEFYWNYDKDSLVFSEGTVPENTEENQRLFEASADCEYGLSSKAGTQAVMATAALLHYNGDVAGQMVCYFTGSTLSGIYYQGGYDNGYYSLKERNPFLLDGGFTAYEAWSGMSQAFQQTPASFPAAGFLSLGKDQEGNVLSVSIEDGALQIYRYRQNALRLWRTLTFGSGLEATSAVFLDGEGASRLAVLLSSITENGEGEGEHTFARSEKIVFYDENMQLTEEEIPLDSVRAGALAWDEGQLLLSVDQSIQFYQKGENGWERKNVFRLKHQVDYIHITDLDGNGTKEYLMSDGMDLYLYHRSGDSFRQIWSTHLGVESLYGAIASGDLNGDGVKEVYVCDMTGTTIRYILTEEGLRSSNEDIAYGQCIYPCDLNHDGLDDYWLIADGESREGYLCIAKTEQN